MGTLTNSENPDEMPQSAAFHQGLHCKGKTELQKNEIFFFFENYNLAPLIMYMNGPSQVYCFKPEGIIH